MRITQTVLNIVMTPVLLWKTPARRYFWRCCGVGLIVLLWLIACAPKPVKPPPVPTPVPTPSPAPIAPARPPAAPPKETGNALFKQAETLFNEKWYPNALDAYNEYLSKFPSGPFADKALMRSAGIYMAMESYEKARLAYLRLLNEYPQSPLAAAAGIELIFAYYHEGKYQEAIDQAAGVKAETLTPKLAAEISQLVGNSYMAIKVPVEAISFYTLAYHFSEPPERERLLPIIKTAIQQLDTPAILSLLGRLDGKLPADYLMYQLGLNKIAEQNFDAAIAVFSAFIDNFPNHEYNAQAKTQLEELIKNYEFNRHTIGCLLPLSGPYKLYGQRALSAIQFALIQHTRQTQNKDIRLVIKDTMSDPDATVAAVRELAGENVAAIVGPLTIIEPAALEAQDKGIPIITLTQKDYIPDIGDFVFRNFFTPRMQVQALVSFAVQELNISRFAILYPDEPYGNTFMNLFWDEVIAHKGTVMGVETYRPTQTDFADPIKKLVGRYYKVPDDLEKQIDLIAEKFIRSDVPENPEESLRRKRTTEEERPAIVDFEAVFIPDSPKKAGLVIPQLAFYDVTNVYLMGTNLWNSNELIQMAREYMQRAIIPAGFFADSESEKVRSFVKGFREIFGETPGFIEAISYDTASILFDLTGRKNILSRTALRNALVELKDYPGVTGLTSFEPNGDVRKKLDLIRVRGSQFIELKRRRPNPDQP
ncbi:MAG: ABC transporter substrate-binding protein [Desulfobacterales bacterium]|nr:ABC transporter substrate-binding protein [Desulfobacterales bacterium]